MRLILVCIFLTLALANFIYAQQSVPLKICSFNVQIFGVNKAKNVKVMTTLGKIFRRYDICLIQEIRDTKDNSINQLLKTINGNTDDFGLVISDRLGRTNSKEQYAFFYKKKLIKVVDSFHFDDESYGDLFEREPFVVQFAAATAPVKTFFIAGIHTSPESARAEIGSLVKVYDDAVKRFKILDGVIMGDFNAGCSYFPKKYWPENPLRSDPRFQWLIKDDADTTVGKSVCAYDRFVVSGPNLPVHAQNAHTYFYDDDYKISLSEAKLVSDHYPIEFTII